MNEHVYLLVPVHNRRTITQRFVESLCKQTRRDFCLVLVDDGSTDGTVAAVRALLPDTVVIQGNGRWWWAGCLDRACRWLAAQSPSSDDIIGLLNDDVEITPDFVELAVQELSARRDTLLLARQIDAITGDEIKGGGGIEADLVHLRFVPAASPEAVNCLPTRGLFLRWRDFLRVGGFRPRLLPHYLSDYEFTLRAHRRGLNLRVADRLTIRIHVSATGWSHADLFRQPRRRRFAMFFSNRFKENPITWSAFIWLAVPPWSRPLLLLKTWGRAACLLVHCLLRPVTDETRR